MVIPRALAVGLCVCALSATSVAAADGPTGGVLVGVNLSSIRLTGADATNLSTGTQAGLLVGGVALWPITPGVAIQPEVAYSQQHFSVKDTISAFTATEKWDWIDVPILARIRVWHTGDHTIYVIGGPGFGFLVRAREEAAGTTSDVKDDVTHVDVSVVAGAGVALGKFGLEARYDAGLKDLNKDHRLGDDLTDKNRTISVTVTWMFR